MVHYDHAMVGATLALAVGAQRRYGWPVVALAALAGACPDWDAAFKHASPQTYQIAHRVWGHNLFAVTLAGLALGGLGYLLYRSKRSGPATEASSPDVRVAPWLGLGVLIAWSHPLFDLLYCGIERDADWPVGLLWPVVSDRFGVPWIPWSDWGATMILLGGLLAALAFRQRQLTACVSLLLLVLYVAVRGAALRWA
jgi:hypothetical protein